MSEEGWVDPLKAMGRVLHQRLLDGDITAAAEIAELFMPVVIDKLGRGYPSLDDPHLIDTAVEEALVSYFERPEQYDPAKLDLAGYLRMSADGDLRNLLKKEKRIQSQQSLSEYVELSDDDTEHEAEVPDDFNLEALVFSHCSPVWQRLSDLLPDPVDQEIVLLMMEGERKTSVYADVLGISSRPSEEQAQVVKRHKDRIKKTLQRNVNRTEVSENE
jgi:hypothetical protein